MDAFTYISRELAREPGPTAVERHNGVHLDFVGVLRDSKNKANPYKEAARAPMKTDPRCFALPKFPPGDPRGVVKEAAPVQEQAEAA